MKKFSALFFKACPRSLHTSAQLFVQEVIQSLMSNSIMLQSEELAMAENFETIPQSLAMFAGNARSNGSNT